MLDKFSIIKFLDFTFMNPTLGDTPLGYIYISVDIFSAITLICKVKKILSPVITCLLVQVSYSLGFYFYKVCSPTPYIFGFSGFSATSILGILVIQHAYCAHTILVAPQVFIYPPPKNFFFLGYCLH